MDDRYTPPGAALEVAPADHKRSAGYRAAKAAIRPIGVVAVVVLFFVFLAIDAAVLFIEGDLWWIVVAAISGVLAYWFRNLWWGSERERKIGVFFGLFCAGLWLLTLPDGPIRSWSVREFVEAAKGCYFGASAAYLFLARKSRFFEELPGH
jgi:hypothetical protein